MKNDAVDDAAVTELLPFFTENDSEAKLAKVFYVILKEYEKYLIAKYAPLNLTHEESVQRLRESTPEEASELRDFGIIWAQITYPYRWTDGPKTRGDAFIVIPDTEEMRTYNRLGLSTYRWSWSTTSGEGSLALSEEQREFLNGLIVSKKITPEAPGILYNDTRPFPAEDRAFVDEAIKDIVPRVSLPWHDRGWQIRERFKQDPLLQERLAQALGENARYVCATNEIEMTLAKRHEILSRQRQDINAKLQAANLTDEDKIMEARIAFFRSWSGHDELEELSRVTFSLRQECIAIESATKEAILEQLPTNEASETLP